MLTKHQEERQDEGLLNYLTRLYTDTSPRASSPLTIFFYGFYQTSIRNSLIFYLEFVWF